MRRSELIVKTRHNAPSDETSKGAQLLIRAGYIHKEMSGVYSYLTLGKKVLDNIADVVRHEMESVGGREVLMSTLQNKDLWVATGRWNDEVVDNWFKTKLASGTEVGIGLSHEEPLTNSLRQFISSYKDLPVYPYQIQTKFRNELRAKSGLLRGREFLMKDLYSYSRNQEEHDLFYEKISEAYMRIYRRLGIGGITYKTFASGGIFARFSHEFQTISEVGEDTVFVDEQKKFAINKEVFADDILHELGLDKNSLVEKRAVEVGNIFSLGTKYSDALGLFFIDEHGRRSSTIMGCYGIGISRLMGLLAEHFADDKGLVWPSAISPCQIYLIRLGSEPEILKEADNVYNRLTDAGISVIYDDRDARAGEMFADADLMGLPYRAVVSQNTLTSHSVELKSRQEDQHRQLSLDNVVDAVATPTPR